MTAEKSEPEFVVLEGRLLVAKVLWRKDRSIAADLFRNLADHDAGRAMEREVRLEF
ncbi:hypothetical protein M9M90_17455 [Phenylobacterium sp. LH3H17]|uniref:hypothetical protein n=1 Tax=Phenylobacterium sp. LH3H17 TaxID=2903901 RepID=UPI0020C9F4D3|nr:hypothetical protein [Phenylobacterium sp. LH3H17]UTP38989.1 hypothetical protein M9M90_17455 [Phenylobacterium sp. LH3H17]